MDKIELKIRVNELQMERVYLNIIRYNNLLSKLKDCIAFEFVHDPSLDTNPE